MKWKIFNLTAWNTPMKNKIKKNLIFILYSWLIYNFYLIGLAPYAIYEDNLMSYIRFVLAGLVLYVFISLAWRILRCIFLPGFLSGIFHSSYSGIILAGMGSIILINIITMFFWWRKQTFARAWALGLTGWIAGPGILYLIPSRFSFPPLGIYLCLLGANLLCFIMFIGNYLQKRFWPDNKLCNRIRSILQWPCLRT